MSDQKFDVIVIGSGIGGLVVASLLTQIGGKRVLVLERHFKPGGFTSGFHRRGRYWDVGLHYVGQMREGTTARRLFDLVTQGKVEWNKMSSPFEKFVYPDFIFEVPDNRELYKRKLAEFFPQERDGIERYFDDVLRVAKWHSTNIIRQTMPGVFRFLSSLLGAGTKRTALMTTADYLKRRFRDQRLKAVLVSQWGDYGLPPSMSAFLIHSLIVAHYFSGGYYPVGGADAIPQSIVPIIESNGGRCLVNHEVTEIIVSRRKAVGVKVLARRGSQVVQKEFFAPAIVSDAGAYETFIQLLPSHVELPFREELKSMMMDQSAVVVYLGLKEDPSRLGFRGENYWIYSGYDHDEMARRRGELLDGKVHFCFLSFPSQRDPKARYHTAEIITGVDYSSFERWRDKPWMKRGSEYKELKKKIAEALIDFVDSRFRGFKDLVGYVEVSTPLTVETFTGHFRGAIYGLPAVPRRFRLPWLKVVTPIENLYLTGADVASPGILGAFMGGVVTSAILLGSLGMRRILSASERYRKRG